MTPRLLALDLDGTVYRTDGTISQWDIDAVNRARECGIAVTIATGRITTGSMPAARELGITTPMVCAEGAVVIDPVTGEVISRQAMEGDHVEWFTHTASEHGLAPFWILHDEIHGEEQGRPHVDYVGIWSPEVTLHETLASSHAWARRGDVNIAVALGSHDAVKTALARVESEHGGTLMAARFPIDARRETWTLLVRNANHDKATGLTVVAQRLGLTARDVAVVGDWVNDIPMFQWAGRSFVMGQSPEHVAMHATDRLTATSATGGGVAEAVMQLLRER